MAASASGAAVTAKADIGVPMVAIFLPPMWAAIVPVVVLEALVVSRFMGIPFGKTAVAVGAANAVSTMVGIPVTWFTLAIGEMLCCADARGLTTPLTKLYAVTVQAPWLIPYEADLGWMIPSALITLGGVFASLSIAVETPIASRMLGLPKKKMWRVMTWANVASYLLLGVLGWAVARLGERVEPLYKAFEPLVMALVAGIFSVASWVKG